MHLSPFTSITWLLAVVLRALSTSAAPTEASHNGSLRSSSIPIEVRSEGLCVNVTIGTPPSAPIRLNLDTGSPFTWTNSRNYTPSLSATAQQTGQRYNVTYVDGNVAYGNDYSDTVHLAGVEVPGQIFGFGNTSGDPEGNAVVQGLMGLSKPADLDPRYGCTGCLLMTNMLNHGVIDRDLFAIDAASSAPAIYFGTTPVEESHMQTHFFDVVPRSIGWMLATTSINGFETGQMVLDSGAGLLLTPKVHLGDICRSIDGFMWTEDNNLFGCNITGSPKPVAIKVGDFSVSLEPKDIYDHITLLIFAIEGYDDFGILGFPFFKNAYVSFYGSQSEQLRVGLTAPIN